MKKRIMTFLTVLCLLTGLFPQIAEAAENDSANSSVVNLLNALGIMETDEYTGRFWNDTPVERQEMAKILCDMFDIEPVAEKTPMFSDVKEEYRGFAETVVRNGYMQGKGDGSFGAKEYITVEQTVKIFVCILGGQSAAEIMGGYPDGYVMLGRKMGILKNTGSLKSNARRIDVARIIYNSLNTAEYDLGLIEGGATVYTQSTGKTFLSERLGIYRICGIVTQNTVTSLETPERLSYDLCVIGEETVRDSSGFLDDFLGCDVTAYVRKTDEEDLGDVIFVCESNNNESVTVSEEDFAGISGYSVTYWKNDKKQTLTLSTVTYMIYNGRAVEYDKEKFNVECGFIKFVDNDGDKKFDVAVITDYKPGVVGNVDAENGIIALKYNEKSIELKDNYVRLTADGEKIQLNRLIAGSVILVAASGEGDDGVYEICLSSEKAMGKIEKLISKNGKRYLTVGGKEYKISSYCEKLIENNFIDDFKTNLTGQFFMDGRGNVVYALLSDGGLVPGYLVNSAFSDEAFSKALTVKLYTLNQKFEMFSAADKLTVDNVKKNVSDIESDLALKSKLKTPQLILYSAKDGVLKEIVFAKSTYDEKEFSLDLSGVYKCTRPSVIAEKYVVPASSQVFYVPTPPAGVDGYDEYMNDEGNYAIYGGGHFSAGNYFGLSLYDINSDGEAKYAVSKKDPSTGNVNESSKFLAVTNVGEGINKKGETSTLIEGLDESGNEISLIGSKDGEIKDSQSDRIPVIGDVIQYHTNSDGEVTQIIIQLDVTDGSYFAPKAVESSKTDYTVSKCYGEVLSAGGSSIRIAAKPIDSSMTVLDGDMYVQNTGKAVLRCNADRTKIVPENFSTIEKGDRVFVSVNRQNYTRMIVIYD